MRVAVTNRLQRSLSYLGILIYYFRMVLCQTESVSYNVSSSIQEQVANALDQHGDTVLRLAFAYLHNRSDAEDIVQETYLKMLTSAPHFNDESHQKAWLLRVAANLSKNKLKAVKIRRAEQLYESIPAPVGEDLSFVWEAVGTLPVNYREVIHLFYQEDMTTAEIAEFLGKQEGTVRSLLHRARHSLKKQLKEAYDFEE